MLCETLFQIFQFSSDGCLLSAQRCFDFHVLPILFKSQCWNFWRVSVDYTCQCLLVFQVFWKICSAKRCFKWFTVVVMELSYRHSAALLFAGLLYCSSLNVETFREFRKTTLANLMLNFFSVLLNDVSYKQRAALLFSCFLFWFKSQS